MKRALIGLLSSLAVIALVASSVQAAPKQKKKGGAAATPVSAEISKAMGDLSWGMTKDELQKKLIDKVKERYRPLVAKSRDAVDEDNYRQKANGEIKRIRESYVQFTGTSTGWDVSFLRGEFTHGNDESMRDENSQNFYFFFGDRLWKWYKAFDAEVFDAGNFAGFGAAVQRKFGNAKDARGELSPGAGERHWLEWQDDKSRLRAVDQTDFYGFYCLVFEDKATVASLGRLRTNTQDVGKKQHSLIEAVTAPSSHDPDESPDIADRITGKIRQRQDAPSSSSAAGSGSGKKGSKSSAGDDSASGVRSDDDPLSGLGL
jgi:hypothetical protein